MVTHELSGMSVVFPLRSTIVKKPRNYGDG